MNAAKRSPRPVFWLPCARKPRSAWIGSWTPANRHFSHLRGRRRPAVDGRTANTTLTNGPFFERPRFVIVSRSQISPPTEPHAHAVHHADRGKHRGRNQQRA